MRRAQISLTNYFVSELSYATNPTFDAGKPSTTIEIADYQVTPQAKVQSEDRRKWEVHLRIALEGQPDRNFPCSFMVNIQGSVEVDSGLREDYIERFVNINGVAVVFGAAREIIRAITSTGRNGTVLLPSVTFWEPKEAPAPASAVAPASTGS